MHCAKHVHETYANYDTQSSQLPQGMVGQDDKENNSNALTLIKDKTPRGGWTLISIDVLMSCHSGTSALEWVALRNLAYLNSVKTWVGPSELCATTLRITKTRHQGRQTYLIC